MQDADRQDARQEVWCAVITHLGQYAPERGPFQCWLETLIRNVLVSGDRATRRFRRRELGAARLVTDRNWCPEDPFDVAEAREHVAAAMAELRTQLSEMNYRIIHDHWLEGKDFSEIAVGLSLTLEQVRARHHRAMAKLGEIVSRGSN